MLSDFIHVKHPGSGLLADEVYYLGGSNDGSMKSGSQSVKDDNGDTYKFYFENKSGASKALVLPVIRMVTFTTRVF